MTALDLFRIPVRFNHTGNSPDAMLTEEEVVHRWKTQHLYEIAFLSDDDKVVEYGDIEESEVAGDAAAFALRDTAYRHAIERFLGDRPFALATASSHDARKISWRYFCLDRIGTAAAQKANAVAINARNGIALADGTPVKLDESVYHKGRKMRMLHAWKQQGNEPDTSKWENRPLRIVKGDEEDTLLHRIPANAELMDTPNRPPKAKGKAEKEDLPYADFHQLRTLVIDVLPESEANDYACWRNVLWAIKGTENSPRARELAHDFSKRSAKYDADAVERVWAEGNGSRTAGSIHHRARAHDPVKYAQATSSISVEFLEREFKNGDIGKATIFAEHFCHTLVAVPSPSKRTYYAFDVRSGLWCEVNDDKVITLFTAEMKHILRPLAIKLAADHAEIAETPEGKVQRKKLEVVMMTIELMTKSKAAKDCLPQIHTRLMCDKWTERLNKKRDILPVANGVLNLRDGTLRPYEREDYLTLKLPINYHDDADTSKQDKFFRDVLRDNADDIEYIHYFLGYCLTGETALQKLLVLEGSLDGANGKSVLLECLANVLGNFYATMNRKVFKNTDSVNNDSLYDAEYARLACVPEMNKSADIDEGLVKTITGQDKFVVAAKYKNNKEFYPMWKIVMPLNEMFAVPADSGAMWRRIVIMPFNVRFLSRNHPDWDDDDFAEKNIQQKDDAFVDALRANKEGWLAWLVRGAQAYYANPAREPPLSLQKHLTKTQAQNDGHMRFIQDSYVKTGDDNDKVSAADVVKGYRRCLGEETDREKEKRLANETKDTTAIRIASAMKKLKVAKTKNPIYFDGIKQRCWLGLRLKSLDEKLEAV